ncbi:hypothetical protein PHMEG_00030712 [Phytophthora megakarya]|uniref:MULE transposase domain-containing protein n=1 Tax=Phytophthora megakarya TaxID=4795 RepID=A0A225V294_9STRA|nr:hypothetical protein PHMEG_00030712 [Phytophthora megakarya]
MPPSQQCLEIKQCETEDEFNKFRWKVFCCSVVRGVRPTPCSICPGDHERIEKHLHYKSETCRASGVSVKCPTRWKMCYCNTSSTWVIFSNQPYHLRGIIDCSVPPRPKVTQEMKEYIRRVEENAIAPRLIWSNLLRSPEIPEPALGYPSYAQVKKFGSICAGACAKYNKCCGSRPQHRLWFGNRENADGFPYVGNGEDEEPLILGITTKTLLRRIMELQEQETFLVFHMDATFKVHDLGYPVITCKFTYSHRFYQLAALFINTMKSSLRIDAVMGDAESAHVNVLEKLPEFENGKYLMCFFHVLYNVRRRIRHLSDSVRGLVYRGILDMHYARRRADFESLWSHIYHSPGGYATTNSPYFQLLKVHWLPSSLQLHPCVGSHHKKQKQLVKALVTSERVAVFSTNEDSVVRVCYIGDRELTQSNSGIFDSNVVE